ncbi:small secreted protein [Aspergillus ellipticus CBS 707.79]|uniref:Small secreted protein n=1 Tax=Aspergillus ellipticus CBS 707.79 TaxID=1448320 RepID=A0A319DAC4_9EURO|nr:small secreted protein [Aspergillus ellipticus CBS 707.79]
MVATKFLSVLFTVALAAATLDPASSNTKGKCPGTLNCSAAKTSTAIQAAECSHNTRTSETQTFAVFTTDHEYDSSHGAPYGTCKAYTCTAPTDAEMTDSDSDCWTFFWNDNGESSGVGTGCIRSPTDGTCGCEDSDGTFVAGSSSCT